MSLPIYGRGSASVCDIHYMCYMHFLGFKNVFKKIKNFQKHLKSLKCIDNSMISQSVISFKEHIFKSISWIVILKDICFVLTLI